MSKSKVPGLFDEAMQECIKKIEEDKLKKIQQLRNKERRDRKKKWLEHLNNWSKLNPDWAHYFSISKYQTNLAITYTPKYEETINSPKLESGEFLVVPARAKVSGGSILFCIVCGAKESQGIYWWREEDAKKFPTWINSVGRYNTVCYYIKNTWCTKLPIEFIYLFDKKVQNKVKYFQRIWLKSEQDKGRWITGKPEWFI